jgi:hypothetical protein
MGTDLVPFRGALNVWNLEGCVLDVWSQDPLKWSELREPHIQLADLGELSHSQLRKRYVEEPVESPVTAIIRIHGGTATPAHIPGRDVTQLFPTYEYVDVNNSEADGDNAGILADMVQVTMDLPAKGVEISKGDKSSDHLFVCGDVAMLPVPPNKKVDDPVVVVTFSNLCNRSEPLQVDKEFAQFYTLVVDQQAKRRVPKMTSPKPSPTTGSCGGPVVTRIPFGDCFLGAKIACPTGGEK